jgi:hypothetical protein
MRGIFEHFSRETDQNYPSQKEFIIIAQIGPIAIMASLPASGIFLYFLA